MKLHLDNYNGCNMGTTLIIIVLGNRIISLARARL